MDIIFRVCCDVFDIDLSMQTRKRDVVYKRWIYYNIVRDFTKDDYSLEEMSKKVNQTHAMALRAFDRKQDDIMDNKHYRKQYFKCLNAVSKQLKATVEIEEMIDVEQLRKECAELRLKLDQKNNTKTMDEFVEEILSLDRDLYGTFKMRGEIILKSLKSVRTYENTPKREFNAA